jgi:hypothetical protein
MVYRTLREIKDRAVSLIHIGTDRRKYKAKAWFLDLINQKRNQEEIQRLRNLLTQAAHRFNVCPSYDIPGQKLSNARSLLAYPARESLRV